MQNLIDKVIRYTLLGGRVMIQVHQHAPDLLFRIEDAGQGLMPEVLTH